MIFIKTGEEIEFLRQSNLLVSKTLAELAKWIRPGISTLELDKIGHDFIFDHGGVPAFLGYRGFPNSLCISVNHAVVHGIPSDYRLNEGDIVSVDCGAFVNGFVGDSAYTFPVGAISPEKQKLLDITLECLYHGISNAVAGRRTGDIGYAIQQHAEANGFSVVRELVGHGVGRNLHEKPEVPNFGKRGNGIKLSDGLTIAIEPMINMGEKEVVCGDDGWTIFAADLLPSAHFEHSIVIRKGKAELLSTFNFIEEALKRN
jgi:methionyl aminopeptidase